MLAAIVDAAIYVIYMLPFDADAARSTCRAGAFIFAMPCRHDAIDAAAMRLITPPYDTLLIAALFIRRRHCR